MIRHSVSIMVFSCVFVAAALAANPTASKTTPQNSPTATQGQISSAKQWEYLIVSFGKTLFTDPTDNPETKAVGLSKLLSYSKAGVVSAQEALVTQNQMDTLGKFGWELIDIVGAIGGDQEMVFRRAYDPERSKQEAVLIKKEGERLIAEQQDAATRLALSMKETTELIDLDAVEKAAATNETRRKEEARLMEAINTIKIYPISSRKVISTADDPTASRVAAEIEIDGTAALLTGNKYRSSEANKIAKQIARNIYNAAGLGNASYIKDPSESFAFRLGEVKISVLVKASFQGTTKIISTENVGGQWSERVKGR
ncbi:MAG: hypothetical protein Q7J31_03705 [Syntrophales bacterium]|nr:hypothetical protein [Syntrophales bacterium]